MQGVPPVHAFAGGGLQRALLSRPAASGSVSASASSGAGAGAGAGATPSPSAQAVALEGGGAEAALREESGARVLPFRRGLPLVELSASGTPTALGWQRLDDVRKWFTASEPGWDGVRGGWPYANVVYLGVSVTQDPAIPCLAVELPEDAGKPDAADAGDLGLSAVHAGGALRFEELRGLMQASRGVGGRGLGGEELAAAGQAKAFLEFSKRTRFCALCGAPCVPVEGGVKRSCVLNTGGRGGGCRGRFYPRVDPVMICLVISPDGERCLLGAAGRLAPGHVVLPRRLPGGVRERRGRGKAGGHGGGRRPPRRRDGVPLVPALARWPRKHAGPAHAGLPGARGRRPRSHTGSQRAGRRPLVHACRSALRARAGAPGWGGFLLRPRRRGAVHPGAVRHRSPLGKGMVYGGTAHCKVMSE